MVYSEIIFKEIEMQFEYIKTFSQAAFKVVNEITELEVELEEVIKPDKKILTSGIASIIGILGDSHGHMILDMEQKTACRYASAMNDQELNKFDEFVCSTICELVNIIAGRAVSELNNKGHKLDITPPAVFSGIDMNVYNRFETVLVLFKTDLGSVRMNLTLVRK